jgi:2-phosphosulfolactate phosphatase
MYQAGNDEAVAAQALYLTWQNQLERLFHRAAHGQRLLKLQGDADLAYCAKVDLLRVVPLQGEPGILRANLSQS